MPFSMPTPKLCCEPLKKNKAQFVKQLETETDETLITELNLKISIINRLLGL